MGELRYKRVLLKLSGEALAGDQGYGIDPLTITTIANEIKEVVGCGVQLSLVIGGGNIFRGLAASSKGMDRASAGASSHWWAGRLPRTWRCSAPSCTSRLSPS